MIPIDKHQRSYLSLYRFNGIFCLLTFWPKIHESSTVRILRSFSFRPSGLGMADDEILGSTSKIEVKDFSSNSDC